MNDFGLSARSLNNTKGVHPRLVATMILAHRSTTVDWGIIEGGGVRSDEFQRDLYAQGRTKPGNIVTWTLQSNHKIQPDGWGHALDLVPYYDGRFQWPHWRGPYFHKWVAISDAMFEAAETLGVKLRWGGDWTKVDAPHWEIDL